MGWTLKGEYKKSPDRILPQQFVLIFIQANHFKGALSTQTAPTEMVIDYSTYKQIKNKEVGWSTLYLAFHLFQG